MFQKHTVHFYRNFTVEDYARLIKNCDCLLGNSSSGLREGSFMGVPVVNIGTRQTGREKCINVIDANYNKAEIEAAVRKQLEHGSYKPDHLYGDGTAGKQITEVLATNEIDINKRLTY